MIGDNTDLAMTEQNQKRLRILAVDDHQVMLTFYREALSFRSQMAIRDTALKDQCRA
jgi:hypothetical protein